MTDDHRPVPHPRPAPSKPPPNAAAPVPSHPAPSHPAPPDPNLQPTVVLPAITASLYVPDNPPAPDQPLPVSRTARRRAEKANGRQQVLRRLLPVVAVLLVAVLIVAIVLAVTSGGSSPQRGAAATTPAATATGANLADPNAASTFLGAAGTDVAAVTTYDYRHLDEALNDGLAVTTGQYRQAYRTALTGDLARTATAEHVIHKFELLNLGIGQISQNGLQAKVLVFGRERINDDRTGPDAQIVPITLVATIRRDGDLYRISDLVQNGDAGLPPAGPDLPAAASAARNEVVNLLSFKRAEFDTDLQRALDGATSPLRQQLQRAASATKNAMTEGKFDMTGTITAMAVVRAEADTVTLLVAADAGQHVDGTATPTVTQRRYEVTVARTLDGWAASGISSVDGGSLTGV